MIGKVYGNFTIIGEPVLRERNKRKRTVVLAKCKCGTEKVVILSLIKNNHLKSCGCMKDLSGLNKRTTHGLSKTRLYRIYHKMMQRCYNESEGSYKWYGEKGISVCRKWKNSFLSFYDWAINNGYKKHLTIDRINTFGNYSPDNCRWATMKQQLRNQSTCIIVPTTGLCLSEHCEKYGYNYGTIISRYRRGKPFDEIFSKHDLYLNKKIKCIETGTEYQSLTKAVEELGGSITQLCAVLNGRQRTFNKHTWVYI